MKLVSTKLQPLFDIFLIGSYNYVMLFYSFSNSYVQRECLLTELSALSHIAAKLWFATIYPKFLLLNVNLMYA